MYVCAVRYCFPSIVQSSHRFASPCFIPPRVIYRGGMLISGWLCTVDGSAGLWGKGGRNGRLHLPGALLFPSTITWQAMLVAAVRRPRDVQ